MGRSRWSLRNSVISKKRNSRFSQAGAPRKGALPAFFFWALISVFSSASTARVRQPRPKATAPRDYSRLWADALDFTIEENDSEGLEALRIRILKERPEDLTLLNKLLEVEVRRKDRLALVKQMTTLRDANHCLTEDPATVCASLAKLWDSSLSQILFYEESAGKLEKVRRAIEVRDCASALPVLKEIIAREGPQLRPYLERLAETQACLGDGLGKAATDERLKELRIFNHDA